MPPLMAGVISLQTGFMNNLKGNRTAKVGFIVLSVWSILVISAALCLYITNILDLPYYENAKMFLHITIYIGDLFQFPAFLIGLFSLIYRPRFHSLLLLACSGLTGFICFVYVAGTILS